MKHIQSFDQFLNEAHRVIPLEYGGPDMEKIAAISGQDSAEFLKSCSPVSLTGDIAVDSKNVVDYIASAAAKYGYKVKKSWGTDGKSRLGIYYSYGCILNVGKGKTARVHTEFTYEKLAENAKRKNPILPGHASCSVKLSEEEYLEKLKARNIPSPSHTYAFRNSFVQEMQIDDLSKIDQLLEFIKMWEPNIDS